MNREIILSMQPGRELDELVAIKVMGYEKSRMQDGYVRRGSMATIPKPYSRDITAAWEVVEKMGNKGWMLYNLAHTLNISGKIDRYTCIFLNIESGASREAFAATPAEAIAKAALLTHTEVDGNES